MSSSRKLSDQRCRHWRAVSIAAIVACATATIGIFCIVIGFAQLHIAFRALHKCMSVDVSKTDIDRIWTNILPGVSSSLRQLNPVSSKMFWQDGPCRSFLIYLLSLDQPYFPSIRYREWIQSSSTEPTTVHFLKQCRVVCMKGIRADIMEI